MLGQPLTLGLGPAMNGRRATRATQDAAEADDHNVHQQMFPIPRVTRICQRLEMRPEEVLSNVVDEVVSQAATLGRMMPSWNLVSLASSMRCFAASRVRQWCVADSASLKSIVSVALRVPLPLVRR